MRNENLSRQRRAGLSASNRSRMRPTPRLIPAPSAEARSGRRWRQRGWRRCGREASRPCRGRPETLCRPRSGLAGGGRQAGDFGMAGGGRGADASLSSGVNHSALRAPFSPTSTLAEFLLRLRRNCLTSDQLQPLVRQVRPLLPCKVGPVVVLGGFSGKTSVRVGHTWNRPPRSRFNKCRLTTQNRLIKGNHSKRTEVSDMHARAYLRASTVEQDAAAPAS